MVPGQRLQPTGELCIVFHLVHHRSSDILTHVPSPLLRYFGTTGHAQMAQSLIVATGTDHGLMTSNPAMQLSALYHMYVTGLQGIFAYGDTGPNKFTATANGIMFYASYFSTFCSFRHLYSINQLMPLPHRLSKILVIPTWPIRCCWAYVDALLRSTSNGRFLPRTTFRSSFR